MSIPIREEVPIKSFSIAAFICKIEKNICYYLIIRRCSTYLNKNWQMVSGKIEKGETAWQAALREIKEETNIIPNEFYSADLVETFYEINQNCINLVPIFVGFVNEPVTIQLDPKEHDEYKWVTKDEAKEYLEFKNQINAVEHIDTYFIKKKPGDFLRINIVGNCL
ncbi:MAG: NUDIX domain-containing protein [Spirochaetales bacterium]|nr:NUDIX domain-containing protein [Spirochaetales bacterium]